MTKTTRGKLSAALLLLGAAACAGEAETTPVDQVRPARLVTTEAASNSRTLELPAVVRSARSSQLTFQVGGQVSELLVLEGQEVVQGDVIARLDDRDYRNNVATARAQYENAEAEYQRARRLAAQDAISRSVLEGRRAQRDVARATLDSAEKNLDDTVLTAPFSGGISRVYIEQFQNVQAKELIADIQSEGVEATVNVPASIVAFAPQFETVGASVILDAAPDIEIPAEFKEASGQADPNTQTYEVSFSFAPPENLLILPGMTATLRSGFEFAENSTVFPQGVAAPLSAIVAQGDEKFVWVVNMDDMTVSKRPVTVNAGVGEEVTVIAGLEGGETIVAVGGAFLYEGMQVRPWRTE